MKKKLSLIFFTFLLMTINIGNPAFATSSSDEIFKFVEATFRARADYFKVLQNYFMDSSISIEERKRYYERLKGVKFNADQEISDYANALKVNEENYNDFLNII